MPHFYLGQTKAGATVARKSTNPSFTHAAVKPGFTTGSKPLPNFSTSAAGAATNYGKVTERKPAPEIVSVEKVEASAYYAATKKGR
jgi:hypothetical protein